VTHKELDELTKAIADVLPIYLAWEMRPLEREISDLKSQVAFLRGKREGAAA
jgi:hypothetical protein